MFNLFHPKQGDVTKTLCATARERERKDFRKKMGKTIRNQNIGIYACSNERGGVRTGRQTDLSTPIEEKMSIKSESFRGK